MNFWADRYIKHKDDEVTISVGDIQGVKFRDTKHGRCLAFHLMSEPNLLSLLRRVEKFVPPLIWTPVVAPLNVCQIRCPELGEETFHAMLAKYIINFKRVEMDWELIF